jgi:hypothetical protein
MTPTGFDSGEKVLKPGMLKTSHPSRQWPLVLDASSFTEWATRAEDGFGEMSGSSGLSILSSKQSLFAASGAFSKIGLKMVEMTG